MVVSLWDSSRAVIMKDNNGCQIEKGGSITRIELGMMLRVRPSGGSRSRKNPYGPQEALSKGKTKKRYHHELRRYIDQFKDFVTITRLYLHR